MPPVLDRHALEMISRSAEQTRRVGMRLGALLQPGDVIALEGDLGSGKTTLVQGIAAGWGSLDPVSSPTFVLVKVYRRADKQRFYHLDAYRLSGPAEAIDLDLENMIAGGPLVVEWAERIESALPDDRLWVSMKWLDETRRHLLFSPQGDDYEKLVQTFRDQLLGAS